MVKVCHMTSAHNPEDVRIFHKECVTLAQAGYDVFLVECGDTYEKDGVHILGAGRRKGGRLYRMTCFAYRVYRTALKINADIYHFHDPELLPFGLKLKKKGKIVIFDSHEHTAESIMEKTWLPVKIRKKICSWYKGYQKKICSRLDAVVTVTPHIAEYFRPFSQKVCLVSNYPILTSFDVYPDYTAGRLVFAGGVSKQWNHHTVLKAMENIELCSYWLCGPADNDYLEKLHFLPAWNRVNYMGVIPHNQVFDKMLQCSVGLSLLTPGRNTGWQLGTMGNTKIFEQMMVGLPVICTDFKLWREFIEEYHCGICVNPADEQAIAKAVSWLLSHPDEAETMGENGRKAVKEKFSWDSQAEKLLALYANLLK